MIEKHEEDTTFRKCMDYLKEQGVDDVIRCEIAGYFGTYGAQAWNRGLREGIGASLGTDL